MIKEIIHIGLTISDIDTSIDFYKNLLGLSLQGTVTMEGPETDLLFRQKKCKVQIAYLNSSTLISSPPIELIQFLSNECEKTPSSLNKTSISEICFRVDDIDTTYKKLKEKGVEFFSARAVLFSTPGGLLATATREVPNIASVARKNFKKQFHNTGKKHIQ